MLDSWPKLQKGIEEIARKVVVAPWRVMPAAERGQEPTERANQVAGEIERLVWSMRPRPERHEHGLEGTVRALVRSYYYGHGVEEIHWKRVGREWRPKCTKTVPARFFGYPFASATEEDYLRFDPTGNRTGRSWEDFPAHRFLIAVNTGHAGHPSTAAPLRALASYWLAATYGLKWFCQFAQLYGIPWRHAQIADDSERSKVESALSSIGASGYIVTKTGTKIDVLQAPGTSGQNLPQKALVDLADQQCDQFILGQTLTSGTDSSGSRALGEVHQGTLDGVVSGVADFVGEIFTHQFIPSIYALNYGERDSDDLPGMWAKTEPKKDLKITAETLEIAARMGVRIPEAFLHEELKIPVPEEGESVLSRPAANGAEGDPPTGPAGKPHETKQEDGIEAADATEDKPPTLEDLAESVLEGLTGVSLDWLRPVRPIFERLAALAQSKTITDEDFVLALEKAQAELPEIFELMDTRALEDAFEKAIGSAMLAGSTADAAP